MEAFSGFYYLWKRQSFKIKLIVVFVLFSLSISAMSLYYLYHKTIMAQMDDLKASILMTASLGAKLIDGDAHETISLERGSINSREYQGIKENLSVIRKAAEQKKGMKIELFFLLIVSGTRMSEIPVKVPYPGFP